MDRQTFLMVTGLAMVGAVSSCTLDARDEAARASTPMPTDDTDGGNDGGADDAAAPECREDFDCCENPAEPCGRMCREERCIARSVETCNGLDDDVDGAVDEDFNLQTDVVHCGECNRRCDVVLSHVQPDGVTCDDGVCRIADDGCADGFSDINGTAADGCEYACHVFGDGTELPNGRDDNCDGATDEGFACAFQTEQPCGSGTGICQEGVQRCVDGIWSDCEGEVGPVPETCNGLDDDCNGTADNGLVLTPEVCDDELVDEDCDGEANEGCDCVDGAERSCGLDDPSLDGVGTCRLGVQSCIAGVWDACSGALSPSDEVCNGLDDDCDGTVPADELDADGDGFTPCAGDCDDVNPFVNPNMPEALCDGVDENCDGEADETFSIGELCTGLGACAYAFGGWECADPFSIRCSVDIGGTAFAGSPELPNGLDDDCDGVEDNSFACVAGDLQPCGTDIGLHGIGVCRLGFQACGDDGQWGECLGAIAPSDEVCNGLDDDCDGVVPADEADADADGVRVCAGDCDDGNPDVSPAALESCNDTDDDCDGDTDEDFFVNVPCDGEGPACGLGVYECASPTTYRCSSDIGGSDYDGSAEVCDSIDNDCNGVTDLDVGPDVVAADTANCGACGVTCAAANSVTACVEGVCTVIDCDAGFLLVSGSCLRCEVWPPVAESCDDGFVDDDCDGLRNEDCGCIDSTTVVCGIEPALHGVGECRLGAQTCEDGAFSACTGAVPPSPEVCNDLDDDCDGVVPLDELDADGDGFTPCAGDCNDGDASVFPSAEDVCNLVDDDCDGAIDEFYFVGAPCNRGTSFGPSCQIGVLECDLEFPAGPARCSTSPNGSMYPLPAPAETCGNLVDDDCDGSVDEDCGDCEPAAERPCGVASGLNGVGICRVGVQTCGGDRLWGSCVGAVTPSPEACNSLDDDCDGVPDDGFDLATDPANCGACGNDCTARANVAAATCAAGICGGFTCRSGFQDLDGAPANGCEYGCFPTNGGVEQCDGIDNDCDGAVDDDPSCSPDPAVTDTVTFAVTLPEGFPVDGSRVFCSTLASGPWTCGDFALTLGGDGRTLTTSGTAVSGPNVFNLCTSACSDPVLGTWVVVRNPDDTLSQAAVPTVTFAAVPVATSLVFNPRRTGGNWFAELTRP